MDPPEKDTVSVLNVLIVWIGFATKPNPFSFLIVRNGRVNYEISKSHWSR